MRTSFGFTSVIVLIWTILSLFPGGLTAQEEAKSGARQPKALLIPVKIPLQGQEDETVKQSLQKALASFPKDAPERPTIVIEFRTKEGDTGQGTPFERALSLSRFLISGELKEARLVAYVPNTLKGHAILPVLACEQVILANGVALADAGIDETVISPTLIEGYQEIANARRTFPAAVAIGLLDKSVTVSRVETSNGSKFVLANELNDLQSKEAVTRVETVLDSEKRSLSADVMRTYGFASHLASGRTELASRLNLAPEGLEEDPSLTRPWKAFRVRLDGPLTQRNVRWVRDQMQFAINKNEANFICLEISSGGGDIDAALTLVDFLTALEPATTRTVAYVVENANSDATLIALACDQIIMAPGTSLGGVGEHNYATEVIEDRKASMMELYKRKGRDWSLPLAMLDPSLELRAYKSADGVGTRYWTEEEFKNQEERDSWTKGEAIDLRDELLPEAAIRLGIVRGVAESIDELAQQYHLTEPIALMQAGWAHELVQRLADPKLAAVLLFVAFFALFLEAMTPGLGLPSIVSALCFILFFWSQFLHGTAGWLEVLLFVTGAACIIVELFVVPGFGVFGLGGILMVVSSIVLASQTFIIPTNAYQLRQLPTSLYMITAALSGTAACMFLMRKYLPNAPMMKRMMLQRAAPEEIELRKQRESFAVYDFLLNKRGTVVTPLTPAGKARFGDDLVDVVSADGDYVDRQADVYVVEVRGTRVAVRKIG
jgi:membrane-bound serine protease (ClpP class)